MTNLDVNMLNNYKKIRFDPDLDHTIYKRVKDSIKDLVENTKFLNITYKELDLNEIKLIFLDETAQFKSTISAEDLLEIVAEMSTFEFNDGNMNQLSDGKNHAKKALDDIQKEKELAIKDLEGPKVGGVSGPSM